MGEREKSSAILRKLELIVTRMDERLNNFVDMYKQDKVELKGDMDNLCQHVNHELTKFDSRIKLLEEIHLAQRAEVEKRKADAKKWKIIIGSIAGAITTIITALHVAGVF